MTLTLSPLVINSELHLEPADPYLEEEDIRWQLRHSHDSCAGSLPTPRPGSGQGPPQAPPPQASPGGWGFQSLPWVGMNTLGVGGTARRTRAQTPFCLF